MKKIPTLKEKRRGCGFRKPGFYLVSKRLTDACGKLPLNLNRCPTCDQGVKPSRGWAWVDASVIFKAKACAPQKDDPRRECGGCPLLHPPTKAGLLWIGGGFYKDPAAFVAEAREMGVSRRIPGIPRGFVDGETLVLLAHRKVKIRPPKFLDDIEEIVNTAIFAACHPTLQYVVGEEDDEEKLAKIESRGAELVKVERIEE